MAPWPRPNRSKGRLLTPPKPKARPKSKGKPKTRPRPTPVVDPLDEQVQAATEQAFRQPEQEIQGQRDVSAQMAANIPAWYADYRNALANATRTTGAAYQAAIGFQQNAANSSSALDAQQRAQDTAAMQASAQQRGATVDPDLITQGQQAAASRRAMLDSFMGLTANQGAAEVAFRANRETVGAGQEVKAKEGEAARRRAIDREALNLGREKGQYAVTTRQKLLDAAHQRDLEDKAFGLDVAKAQSDEAAKAAALEDRRRARQTTNRNADESRRIAADRNRREEAKDAYQRRRGLGPYAPRGSSAANQKDAFGNTPRQRQAAQDALDRANILAGQLGAKAKEQGVAKVRAFLVSEGVNPLYALAAAERLVNGRPSAKTVAQLKRRGIKVSAPKPKPNSAAILAANPGSAAGLSQSMP